MNSQDLKKLAIETFQGKETNNKLVLEFVNYISAYCAETKCSEIDVLFNEKNYNMVYQLFDSIIIKKKKYLHEF